MAISSEDTDYYFKLNTVNALQNEFSAYRTLNYSSHTISKNINSRTVDSNRVDIPNNVEYSELNELFG